MDTLYLGIDVGTGGVRVGAFNAHGTLVAKGECAIKTWYPQKNYVEQSSEDIWQAVGAAVRSCLKQGNILSEVVNGIGFDATCSLVALGEGGEPVTVSPTGDPEQNVIVWMDHRAAPESEEINNRNHEVLKYVGGKISPEMEPPKLMWLKKNLGETWKRAVKFMDLADYLVFRASGNDHRSLCTTVCKWTYLGHESGGGGYSPSFFRENDLEDLFDNNRVPLSAHPIGDCAGELTKDAASELGLVAGVAVGVGIIDAHAGGIGSLGAALNISTVDSLDQAIALIGGTSSCHMAVSESPRFISGVWGPYYGAMFPGMWLNEGGQSATGAVVRQGKPIIHFNEGDVGSGVPQVLMNDIYEYYDMPPETTLHDIRWGRNYNGKFVWVFEISGGAPPAHFGGWSKTRVYRQPSMYFPLGGGSCSGVSKPGVITWARFYESFGEIGMDCGVGEVLPLDEKEVQDRLDRTTAEWPIANVHIPGYDREQCMSTHMSNHITIGYGDILQELIATCIHLGIPTRVAGDVREMLK